MDSQYGLSTFDISQLFRDKERLAKKLQEANSKTNDEFSQSYYNTLASQLKSYEDVLQSIERSYPELYESTKSWYVPLDELQAEEAQATQAAQSEEAQDTYNASEEQLAEEAQADQAVQADVANVPKWDGLISRLQNANSDTQPDYGFSTNAPAMYNVYDFKPANVDAEWQPPFSNGYNSPWEAAADKFAYTIDDIAKAAAYRGSDANSKPVEYQPVKTQRPVYNPNADWRDQEMSLAQLGSLSQATKYLGSPADAIQMSQAIDQGRISAAMQNPSVMQNIEDNMRNGMTFAEAQSAALTSYLQGMGNNRASATTMGLYTTAADDAAGKALALSALTGDNYAALKGPMGYTPLGLSSAAVDPNDDTIMALQGRNGTQSIDRGSMMNVLAALNPKYGSGVAQALAGNLALYNNPLEIQKNITDMLSKEVQAYRANSGKSPYELALKAQELFQKGDYQNAKLFLDQMELEIRSGHWSNQDALRAKQLASTISSQASKFGQVGNQSGVSYSTTPN